MTGETRGPFHCRSVIWIDDDASFLEFQRHTIVRNFPDVNVIIDQLRPETINNLQKFYHQNERRHPWMLLLLVQGRVVLDLLQGLFERFLFRGVISDLNIGNEPHAGLGVLASAARKQQPNLALCTGHPDQIAATLAAGIGIKNVLMKSDTPEHALSLIAEWLEISAVNDVASFERFRSEIAGLKGRIGSLEAERAQLNQKIIALKTAAKVSKRNSNIQKGNEKTIGTDHLQQMLLSHNHDLTNTASLTFKTLEHLCADDKLVPPLLLTDLHRARIAAKHCDILVQSMTDLMQSPSKRHAGSSSIQDVLREVCEIVKRKTPERTSISLQCADRLPSCAVPSSLLMRVLLNLLLNAIEAMPDGGMIKILARSKPGASRRLVIEVQDDGVGIKKAHLIKVFNHDFSTKGKSQGFGLYIVRQIVTGYKGRVDIRSARGKGTTVRLELPRA